MVAKTAKSGSTTATYRELRDELDQILSSLQVSDLEIDEATKLYARGLELVVQLRQHLETAENTIETLRVGAGD